MTRRVDLPARIPNGLTVLDLCCGAGGLSWGYWLAGYDVVGVDLNPMPSYPFEFHQADALEYLAAITASGEIEKYALTHASWPCQNKARVTAWRGSREDHPDLITPGKIPALVIAEALREKARREGRPLPPSDGRHA